MNVNPLKSAYETLVAAAETAVVTDQAPPPEEWNAEEILAHICLINIITITAACSVASAAVATYDNRIAHDLWTLHRVAALGTGPAALPARIRGHADALTAIAGDLSDTELATSIPTLLVSRQEVLVDAPMSLQALLDGLVTTELPGHTRQLLALSQPAETPDAE
jgi:hypothetical protein